jgi:hypothetical protein
MNLFVPLYVDVDEQAEIANQYGCSASKYGGVGIPNILFMDSRENRLKHVLGYKKPRIFIAQMDSVLNSLKES